MALKKSAKKQTVKKSTTSAAKRAAVEKATKKAKVKAPKDLKVVEVIPAISEQEAAKLLAEAPSLIDRMNKNNGRLAEVLYNINRHGLFTQAGVKNLKEYAEKVLDFSGAKACSYVALYDTYVVKGGMAVGEVFAYKTAVLSVVEKAHKAGLPEAKTPDGLKSLLASSKASPSAGAFKEETLERMKQAACLKTPTRGGRKADPDAESLALNITLTGRSVKQWHGATKTIEEDTGASANGKKVLSSILNAWTLIFNPKGGEGPSSDSVGNAVKKLFPGSEVFIGTSELEKQAIIDMKAEIKRQLEEEQPEEDEDEDEEEESPEEDGDESEDDGEEFDEDEDEDEDEEEEDPEE